MEMMLKAQKESSSLASNTCSSVAFSHARWLNKRPSKRKRSEAGINFIIYQTCTAGVLLHPIRRRGLPLAA